MSPLSLWSVLAGASSMPLPIGTLTYEAKNKVCYERVELMDYENPIYMRAGYEDGKCPEGYENVPITDFPCRKLLKYANQSVEIPVECPKRGRRPNKDHSTKGP